MADSSSAGLPRIVPETHPAWQAVLRAPVEDGEIPEKERLAIEQAMRSGRFTDHEDVVAMLEARRPR
ncbi:MAG: hypothetical protein IT372_11665 [Polyangiaceae bacterium]|nr:hypothetical protein [Polyangiaceae bacterium]